MIGEQVLGFKINWRSCGYTYGRKMEQSHTALKKANSDSRYQHITQRETTLQILLGSELTQRYDSAFVAWCVHLRLRAPFNEYRRSPRLQQ